MRELKKLNNGAFVSISYDEDGVEVKRDIVVRIVYASPEIEKVITAALEDHFKKNENRFSIERGEFIPIPKKDAN